MMDDPARSGPMAETGERSDDAALLREYAESRSEAAFAELVRRRIGLVYSVALRHTRDAHRAEDVTQAVFTALARKAGELAQRPVLLGWLYRSAQFAASNAVRVEARRQAREQEAYIMNEIEREAPEPDWNKLRSVLDDVLNAMDERDRDAVLMRYFDGQAFAEIGAKLRLTENAARMRVERALEKMHAALARRGVKSTAAALGVVLANQAAVAAPAGLAASVTGAVVAGTVATSASATAGGAGILSFMSMAKITAGLVAVVALGVAVVSGAGGFGRGPAAVAVPAAIAPEEKPGTPTAAERPELVEQRLQTKEPVVATRVQGVEESLGEVTARQAELQQANERLRSVQTKPLTVVKAEGEKAVAPGPGVEARAAADSKPAEAPKKERSKPERVIVTGAVSSPGSVLFQEAGGLTLIEAISRAGSFNRYADKKRVTLTRAKADGKTESFTINVDDMMRGESAQTWPLQPGDAVHVPEKQWATSSGQVHQPGQYSLTVQGGLTVDALIEKSGGLTTTANPQKVRVSRSLPNGTSRLTVLNLEAGEGALVLENGDIVYVPEKIL